MTLAATMVLMDYNGVGNYVESTFNSPSICGGYRLPTEAEWE
jgi:formylglycine-generating enzyme required for sulfatase activity